MLVELEFAALTSVNGSSTPVFDLVGYLGLVAGIGVVF
jgi:hypothetical protein